RIEFPGEYASPGCNAPGHGWSSAARAARPETVPGGEDQVQHAVDEHPGWIPADAPSHRPATRAPVVPGLSCKQRALPEAAWQPSLQKPRVAVPYKDPICWRPEYRQLRSDPGTAHSQAPSGSRVCVDPPE